ncbi:ATP-binding protein [Alcaligenes faecalis]|uniref:ATP-binding protein n=1 Tax=Alcaligenes faecalis TaxID=511 RepID=UPI0024BCCDF0|nr:ATP-binding protein [Alcaligenes faecalis]
MSDIMAANYQETGVRAFKGNPFIEALPVLETRKMQFLTELSHYPPRPTAKDRQAGEVSRIMELSILNDIVHPFPEFQKAGLALATIIRESYIGRNPLTVTDRQRRHAIASHQGSTGSGVPFPKDWKSSARGHLVMGISGMGKTTFATTFLMRYPQVIAHTDYQSTSLVCHQVVFVVLRVPHDATLRSLCVQFFEEIDKVLGTNYVRQAKSVHRIAPMVALMNHVATAVSLGFLVIDEVQNLRYARSGNAEFMLNLFSEIIERLGISLLLLATPAVQPVLEGSVRNLRKLSSSGETIFKPMLQNDPQWDEFCEVYWGYSLTRNKCRLSDSIKKAWHKSSAGNTAFASLAFMLAQRNEIGGREIIDEHSFERVSATDMAFLQPAIRALSSRDPKKLRVFDDLLFSAKYCDLRKQLGANDSATNSALERAEEFEEYPEIAIHHDEVTTSSRNKPPKKGVTSRSSPDIKLPMENPLASD